MDNSTITQSNSGDSQIFNKDEVSRLAQVAVLVRLASPTLGLPEHQAHELACSAQDLEAEASEASPDQGRLRVATQRVIDAVQMAGQTTQSLTVLAEAVRHAFGAVFGG